MTIGIRGSCVSLTNAIRCVRYDEAVLAIPTNSTNRIIQQISTIHLECLSEIEMLLAVSAAIICCALLLARKPTIWVRVGILLCTILVIVPVTVAVVSLTNATRAITSMGFTAVIGQGVIYGWVIFGAAICGFFSMVIVLVYNFRQE